MGKRTLVSLSVASIFLAALSGPAWAHPAYKASDPPSGASVSAPPSELWVEFTEAIDGGHVKVFDACGDQVDNGDSTQNLTNDRITVTLSASRAGAYRVDWSVLGSDGHPTKGSFTFTASGGEECPGEEPPPSQEDPRGDGDPPGDESRQGGSDPQPGGNEDPDQGSNRGGEANAGSQSDRNGQRGSDRAGTRETGDRSASRGDIAAPQDQTDTEPTADPAIWDGIPIGDFLVAMGVAALIGAAGGRIYAGIMGPAPRR